MKFALLFATVIAGLAFTVPASSSPPAAMLTIPKLGIFNKPIGNGASMLEYGPIWHPEVHARPGDGKPMVIAGHDVTPVPGYGAHGPFYHLVNLHKGDLVKIRWHGRLRVYRVVAEPTWHQENDYQVVVDKGVEAVWFYSCWPRYTHNGRLWVEADLVRS